MMVTITSMKKIQEPDLLRDQPHRITNKLNKPHPHRLVRHPKSKNRRHYPSEESSAISASTTLTSASSNSCCDELSPVAPLAASCTLDGSDVVIEGLDENNRWSQKTGDKKKSCRSPSSSSTWIRTKASSSSTTRHGWRTPSCCCISITTKQLIVLLVFFLILAISVITVVALLFRSSRLSQSSNVPGSSKDDGVDSSLLLSSSDISQFDREEGVEEEELDNYEYEESSSEIHNSDKSSNSNLDKKEVSRLSWNMLNNNQERASGGNNNKDSDSNSGSGSSRGRHHHRTQSKPIPSSFSGISGGEEVVLPSKMIFTSSNGDLEQSTNLTPNPNSSGESKNKKRSCCRTQKYSQVIKRDGCEPLTVTNKFCFGLCVSVWVPGLFASFPVCKPSFSSWKTVVLTCGKNRDRKRRVRIEKVRRCSCMETDPTVGSPTSKKR